MIGGGAAVPKGCAVKTSGMVELFRRHTSKEGPVRTKSYRALRDGSPVVHIPGSKLPGYDQFVPTGRRLRRQSPLRRA
jgi:hypothetical protein